MKYQFNEQELLSLFYNKKNFINLDVTTPYLKNGYVCATEAHILIKIKAETLNGEYKEIPGCNIDWPADNCNFIISLQEIETVLSSIPQIEEEEKEQKKFLGNAVETGMAKALCEATAEAIDKYENSRRTA